VEVLKSEEKIDVASVYAPKRRFFDSGSTLDYGFRMAQLKKLEEAIKRNEDEILRALHADLKKSRMEGYMTEISVVLDELKYVRRNLKEWMQTQNRHTPLAVQPSKTKIFHQPKGVVLIIAPWNYPFQLLMDPLVGAIAAGCCVVLKPSEDAPATASLVEQIISRTFDPAYISVVQGVGKEVVPALIEDGDFNHIFFTGSPQVGSVVAGLAAKKLASTTLELGGKSPTILDETADLKTATKRILWGKFMNAGQTCVSPDYLLIKEGLVPKFIEHAKKTLNDFYGKNPKESESFPRLIHEKRFDTVRRLMQSGDIAIGGQTDRDECYIAPTIITNVSPDDEIMQEEIFGPLLPVLTWKTEGDILEIIRRNRYPLACYYFGKNKRLRKFILERVEFGGGCINNTLVHFANPDIPVGGIQGSGSGRYHGWYSFECFSNIKTVVKSATWFDPSLKYPPYTDTKLGWLKRLLG
jgi:aldehyde dehydrogenase (NAD+)